MVNYIEQYFYILLCLLGGFIFGFLAEKFVLRKARKYALKTTSKVDDVLTDSLRGLVIVWFVILSLLISVNYLPTQETFRNGAIKLSVAVVILSFAILAARIFIKLIKQKTADISGNNRPSTTIISNITRVIVILIGTMLVLQAFGVSITPILTALGVGGLAVALALQETLSNLFAGIQVIATRKIRNGDYIKLNSGEEGYVLDITWRNTIIKALQNNLIIVPNAKLSSAIITNYNFPDTELAVLIDVGVSYDSDLLLVEQLTTEAAREVLQFVEGGVENFEPFIRYHTFSDSSIKFTVILRGKDFVSQFLIKHEFVKVLQKKYKENKVEIPFPIRTILLKKN